MVSDTVPPPFALPPPSLRVQGHMEEPDECLVAAIAETNALAPAARALTIMDFKPEPRAIYVVRDGARRPEPQPSAPPLRLALRGLDPDLVHLVGCREPHGREMTCGAALLAAREGLPLPKPDFDLFERIVK